MGVLQRCLARGHWRLGSLQPLAAAPCLRLPGARLYGLGVAELQERTLIAVKPDGVQRRLVGDVIKRFEKRGFKLVGLKLLQATEGILADHYHELRRKPFYHDLLQYMTSGPVVAMPFLCLAGVAELQERTLIAVKPDGVQRRLVGDVIKRFEKRGFKLVGLKLLQATEGILADHYHELRRKPFYHDLLQYMTSGPVVAMVWEGYNVVKTSRAMVGETNPVEAKPGTVRGDFSVHVSRNVVHASDSVETAQREISLWFRSNELISWDCCDHKVMYEP
ncbi:nucleoside diphosphate kinase, mitochondrial [Ahaetulla prasina]|uniref:nucleoside diphosphate kinase, mitochondrial n=1 Tax=Ahaetulla prasina TaxID=499056 RepID=UPI0026499B30|nr:nucleoside diphosphate kinase, mitochondrial [Ahaetulla prasina]